MPTIFSIFVCLFVVVVVVVSSHTGTTTHRSNSLAFLERPECLHEHVSLAYSLS